MCAIDETRADLEAAFVSTRKVLSSSQTLRRECFALGFRYRAHKDEGEGQPLRFARSRAPFKHVLRRGVQR